MVTKRPALGRHPIRQLLQALVLGLTLMPSGGARRIATVSRFVGCSGLNRLRVALRLGGSIGTTLQFRRPSMFGTAWRRLVLVAWCMVLVSGSSGRAIGNERDDQDHGIGHRPRATTEPFVVAGTGTVVPQSGSMLVRTNDSIFATLHSSGLVEGTVVTGWFGIFNRPQHCATRPCTAADLANALVRGSVLNFAGRVIGRDGSISIGAFRAVGDMTGAAPSPPNPVPNPGLLRPLSAEIHLVLRTHGEASMDPVVLREQLTTFNGGCPPNMCANVQASIHRP